MNNTQNKNKFKMNNIFLINPTTIFNKQDLTTKITKTQNLHKKKKQENFRISKRASIQIN